MHGGDVVVRSLEEIGAAVVFGLPGGQTGPIYDAIGRSSTVRHVLVRDERHGAYAADAFARVSGRIGICDATVGPGATKLPSGLFEALNASIPMLALVSGLETYNFNHAEKGRMSQGIQQLEMLRPVTKRTFRVTNTEKLGETIRIAAITACSGRPGPVAIEFPYDVLQAEVAAGAPAAFQVQAVYPLYPAEPPAGPIAAAAELLASASRPVIVAGGGVMISGAAEELTALAAEHTIPVLTTYTGKGAIPDNHPMCLGFTGSTGIPVNERMARQADVVFLVGMKSSQNSTFNWTFPEARQRVIHCDVDPEDMNRFFPTEVCLVGDARLTLHKLRDELARRRQADRAAWGASVAAAKQEWQQIKESEQAQDAAPIKPQRVMRALQRCIDAETCVVADASFASGWVAEFLEQHHSGRAFLFPRGAAGLGWALPAAIGVALAGTYRRIVAVAGDGAFAYSLGELATVRQHELPIVSVVLNNSTLGWVKWDVALSYDREPPSTNFNYLDYAAIAQGFGLPAATVDHPAELEERLEQLIAGGGGGVLNVLTAWDEAPIYAYRDALTRRMHGERTRMSGYVPAPSS